MVGDGSGSCFSLVVGWKMAIRYSWRCSKDFECHLPSMMNQASRQIKFWKAKAIDQYSKDDPIPQRLLQEERMKNREKEGN